MYYTPITKETLFKVLTNPAVDLDSAFSLIFCGIFLRQLTFSIQLNTISIKISINFIN